MGGYRSGPSPLVTAAVATALVSPTGPHLIADGHRPRTATNYGENVHTGS